MRIRIVFSKTELIRYISHLDLHRAWERTFRRANIPLVYTKGFSPHPRINLASPLPLGITGENELLDAWVINDLPIDEIKYQIISSLPPGIKLKEINKVDENQPNLQSILLSNIYRVTLLEKIADLEQRVYDLLKTNTLLRTRHGKNYDLRPLIQSITIFPSDEQGFQYLELQLAAREGATGRPDEVVNALGLDYMQVRIHRIGILLIQ